MGKVFAYIDYAVGRNHAWLGDVWAKPSPGTEDNWNVRFNINMGILFFKRINGIKIKIRESRI